MTTLFLLMLAYFLGAIPVSVVICRGLKGIDLRQHGSGNLGATNVWRVLGARWGLATLFLDALKGYLAVKVLPDFIFPEDVLSSGDLCLSGAAAILGHVFSVFVGFRGGKGVATSTGVFLAINPLATALTAVVVIAVIAFTRYVALGSLLAAFLLPGILWICSHDRTFLMFAVLMSVLIIWTHRGNIVRLLQGRENKLERKK